MVTLALKSEKIIGPVSLKILKVLLDQDSPFLDEKSKAWREATYSWLSYTRNTRDAYVNKSLSN